mmetsp:Transcript_16033/g.21017  ORF Transcript_16033/g.21017 Transcript_16033/m.21017 type:complete len:126 (-) Transcript_16033:1818-2195(-)
MTESDVEVRREDQVKINEFGRGNAKLHEKREELENLKKLLEELEDATTELALVEDSDNIKLMLGGESFIDVSEDYANEFCEKEQERLQSEIDQVQSTIDAILARQSELKKVLYARFGSSINLEEK